MLQSGALSDFAHHCLRRRQPGVFIQPSQTELQVVATQPFVRNDLVASQGEDKKKYSSALVPHNGQRESKGCTTHTHTGNIIRAIKSAIIDRSLSLWQCTFDTLHSSSPSGPAVVKWTQKTVGR